MKDAYRKAALVSGLFYLMEQGFLITHMTNGSNDTPARSAQPGRANKNILGVIRAIRIIRVIRD